MDNDGLTTSLLRFVIFTSIVLDDKAHGSNTFSWRPQGWDGFPMFCPNTCKNASPGGKTRENCCACNAKSVWDFSKTFARVNVTSDGLLEGNVSARNIHVHFVQKYLKNFPANICDFPGITRINFSRNLIIDIPSLSCLPNLTHLDLSRNMISAVFKTSLIENRNLRIVDLSNNYITRLEIGTLGGWSAHYMLLSGNLLTTLDVTDVIFERPFCVLDASNNHLSMPTNVNKWKMNERITYGPGFGDFSSNRLKRLPNATDIGFLNLFDFGKLFDFGFDVRNNPIICDCKIAEPLLHFKAYIDIMERDYFNVSCGSPDYFRGRTIPDIIHKKQIKDLLCNYTSTPLCPEDCICEERPQNIKYWKRSLTLVLQVNCRGAGLRRLPRVLPFSKEIEFYMRDNKIKKLTKEHYLSHVTVLDLDTIPTFEKGVLDNMTNIKEFSIPRPAQLEGIPQTLAFLSPCVFLHREDFVMNCTCSHLWMLDWMLAFSPNQCSQYSFKCLNGSGEENLDSYLSNLECINIEDFHRKLLLFTCLSTVFFLFVVVLFLCVWKNEFRIILRSRKICTPKAKTLDEDCIVYILYEDGNQDINSWVIKTLEPFLFSKGLSAFIPSRDLPLGSVRIEEAAWQIAVSRFYIVLLSAEFFNEESFQTVGDWRNIWNGYLSDSRKKLLVINFDLMHSAEITCKKLKAFMRFGNVGDFSKGENETFATVNKTFFE